MKRQTDQQKHWIWGWMVVVLLLGVTLYHTACDGVLENPNQESRQENQISGQDGAPDALTTDTNQPPESRNTPDPTKEQTGAEQTPPPDTNSEVTPETSHDTNNTQESSVPEQTQTEEPAQEQVISPDKSQPPQGCGVTTFRYDAQGQPITTAYVAGSFNGWNPKGDAMQNTQGSLWEVTLKLAEGTHQYKFVIDGKWINDPSNQNTTPDGVGGVNNVLTVSPCSDPRLQVTAHNTSGTTFTATLDFIPGASGAGLAGNPTVTLDRQTVPASTISVLGNQIKLNVTNLAKGIHDIRVQAQDSQGSSTSERLLKVYVGVSTDWRDVTLYFAMIDRFVNGDTSNDAPFADTPQLLNYMGGDFRGLAQKIDSGYFDQLGVNALWITWPIDNPNHPEKGARPNAQGCGLDPKSSNIQWVQTNYTGFHGYWPSDINKVEEHFGTLQDLQDVVDKAHKRGIRILLDFTVNHVHQDSAVFTQGKDKGQFNTPAKICNDVGWDNFPVTCWFVSYLPDINYNNADISKLMLNHVVDWVKKTGADGLRIDALKHIEQSFIRAIRQRTTEEFESTGISFYMVGETFTGDTNLIKKFVGSDQVHGQFDFPLNMQILQGIAKYSTSLKDMHNSAQGIMQSYGNALMSTFIGNHDIARFISMANGDTCGPWDVFSNQVKGWVSPPNAPSSASAYNRLKLAFTYIFSLPGIPLIYYGDEFGMPGAGDPDNRRMMRFDSQLSGNEKSTLAFMQKLGLARQNTDVLRRGNLGPTLLSEQDVLVFSRTGQGGPAIIVLNRSNNTRNLSIPVGQLGLSDGTSLSDVLGSNKVSIANGTLSVSIAGETSAIYIP